MEQITLNMIPKGITPICHASQYDKGRVIRLNIMDGLQGYVLSNESVQLNVRKPDMNIVTTDVDTTSGNTFVDIVTTEQMTACEGDNLCEIVLSAGDVVIASLNFIMRVEVDVLKDGIESETEIHNLTTQIQAINEEIVPQMVADEVANQYDSSNVIFDDEPTEGHDEGYAVKSGGLKAYIPKNIDELDDVEINNPQANQAIVYNPTTHKFENGEVSTVGSIDDLDDVDTTGKAEGDSLRFDPDAGEEGKWVAKPTTVTMTLAEWNAMSTSEQTEWLNSHKNTRLVIPDAPNLTETAKQISYDGGTDTVWDKVEEKANTSDLPTASLVSFDASKWSSKTSNREIRITKYGKVVSMYIIFTLTSALSANEGIISNGGVPPIGLNQNEYQFPITCVSGTNAGKTARVRITKEGGVTDWYSQSGFFASACTFIMNATYITD